MKNSVTLMVESDKISAARATSSHGLVVRIEAVPPIWREDGLSAALAFLKHQA